MENNHQTPTISINDHLLDHWTQEEKDNATLVVDFFQHLMNEHDFEYTINKFSGGSYLQHNRAIPNEIEGLVKYVKEFTNRYPDYSFDVKKIIASADHVVLHSHATLKAKHRGNEDKGFVITDTFRLENGRLVEHWDAIQPIDRLSRFLILLIGGRKGNSNPLF